MYKKIIKIIGHDKVGWSIDRDHNYLSYFVSLMRNTKETNSFLKANIYFFVWYVVLLRPIGHLVRLMRLVHIKKRIIAVVTNDIRNYERLFLRLSRIVDLWIAPNQKVFFFLKNHGVQVSLLPFYTSPKEFYRKADLAVLREKYLGKKWSEHFLSRRIIIGSFQRDSLGNDLMKPKWQKNPDLLIEICKKIKNDVLLVLAGPRRHYIINQCRKYGILYIFIGDELYIDENKDDLAVNNLPYHIINDLYNIIDLYLVCSVSEGGPKAIIESSLSKTLIFSTDVGFAKEYLHTNLIYDKDGVENLIELIYRSKKDLHWKNSIIDHNYKKSFAVFDEESYLRQMEKALFYEN